MRPKEGVPSHCRTPTPQPTNPQGRHPRDLGVAARGGATSFFFLSFHTYQHNGEHE